ncbi:MAG: lysophospholipid acyltransferase family protein, partial [Ktedonobacterales bacterium]
CYPLAPQGEGAGGEDSVMVYYLIRFASWLAGRTPRPWRLRIAGSVTELIYWGWGSKRHVTIANMAQILGTSPRDPRARRLARISWRNFGRYISDFISIPNTTRAEIVSRVRDVTPAPGAYGLLDEALAHGKGVVLVSAHFGAYDVAGIAVASHCPVHLIVETIPDPKMDAMWQEQRRELGMEVLRIEKSPRQFLRVLQENGVVAVAIDRPLPAGEGVPVTFFGRRCWVPGGIAQIALKADAAVVPGFCLYDEHYSSTYQLAASGVIYPEHTGDKRADTMRLTQRMFDALEVFIRERPDQWAMFRAFWPDTEGGEPPAPMEIRSPQPAGAVERGARS